MPSLRALYNPSADGAATVIEGALTASGEMKLSNDLLVGGELLDTAEEKAAYVATHTGVAEIALPSVTPQELEHLADYKLSADGLVRDPDGNVVFDATSGGSFNGWNYGEPLPADPTLTYPDADPIYVDADPTPEGWNLREIAATDYPSATYYVAGDVLVDGHTGTADDPILTTIIAEGSIKIEGYSYLSSDTPGVLMVAGGDLQMSGHSEGGFEYGGAIFVHEQLQMTGHARVRGSVWVEGAEDLDPLVGGNLVEGHLEILAGQSPGWPGGTGTNAFDVLAWHEEPMRSSYVVVYETPMQ